MKINPGWIYITCMISHRDQSTEPISNTSSTGPTVVINNPPRNPSILKSVVTIVGLSAVAYALYKFAGGDAVEAAAEAVTTTAENVGDVEQTANQLARTLAALTKLT